MSEKEENFIAFESEAISDEEEELLGQRRESSVLFNLGSLEEANRHLSGGGSAGGAADDASGLINIQHMTAMGQRSDATATEEPADPIVIAPAVPQREDGSNTGLILGAIVGLIALAGLGGVAFVLANKDDEPGKKVIVEKVIEREKLVEDPETAKKLAAAEAARKAAEAKLAEAQANNKAGDTPGEDPKKDGSGSKKPKSGASTQVAAPEKDAPPSSETEGEKKDGIDGIISAIDNKDKKDETPSSDSKLPKQLTKPQVQSSIRKYNSRIQKCGASSNSGKLSGTIWVAINIAPSGKVSSASITSTSSNFKGTDLGTCVIGVVRAIKFPAAQEGLEISKYPFIIN